MSAVKIKLIAGKIEVPGLGMLSVEEALDLGTTLIAKAKQAALNDVDNWPDPIMQESIILFAPLDAADDRGDKKINFATFVQYAEENDKEWEEAWAVAKELLDSDYGVAHFVDWSLTVGRSRRLELALEMLSWLKQKRPKDSKRYNFVAEINYLTSRALYDRLLAL